jgi:hypothetical protein
VAERSPLPSPEAQPYDPKKHGYNKDWETDNVPDDMEDWDVERLRKLCSRLTEEQYVTVQISTLRKLLVERTSAVAPAEVPLPGKEKE